MITPLEWIGIASGSTVLASAITAAAARRPSMITAFTKSYTDLAKRLTDVEAKVEHLESALTDEREEHGLTKLALADERKEHRVTKESLRVAFRYIREAVGWASGPRQADFPPPPPELLKEL